MTDRTWDKVFLFMRAIGWSFVVAGLMGLVHAPWYLVSGLSLATYVYVLTIGGYFKHENR